MTGVSIVGVGMHPFGRFGEKTAGEIARGGMDDPLGAALFDSDDGSTGQEDAAHGLNFLREGERDAPEVDDAARGRAGELSRRPALASRPRFPPRPTGGQGRQGALWA